MNTTLEFLNTFSAAWLMAVLNTLWQGLAVAAVMWIVLRMMPRVNAATRHAVWWAVLALVVFMPLTILLPRRAPVPSAAVPTEKQIQTRALPAAAKPLAVSSMNAPAPPLASVPLPALDSRPVAAPRVRIPIEFHRETGRQSCYSSGSPRVASCSAEFCTVTCVFAACGIGLELQAQIWLCVSNGICVTPAFRALLRSLCPMK